MIPHSTCLNNCGHYIDQRPASNMDPYLVTSLLVSTTLGIPLRAAAGAQENRNDSGPGHGPIEVHGAEQGNLSANLPVDILYSAREFCCTAFKRCDASITPGRISTSFHARLVFQIILVGYSLYLYMLEIIRCKTGAVIGYDFISLIFE